MSIFKTQSGAVLGLKPVSADLAARCVKVDRAMQGKTPEEIAPIYQELMTSFFEEGIMKFALTKYQEAQVTIVRPELKKLMPGLRKDVSDFALYIHVLVPTYEESTRLLLAILEETNRKKPGKEKAKTGFLPFGRRAPAGKQAG